MRLRELAVVRLGLPVVIEMDANAAALGKRWRGAAHGLDHFAYIIVGTGIGPGMRQIVDEAGYYLGLGLSNLVGLLDPQAVVLGGGPLTSTWTTGPTARCPGRGRPLESTPGCTVQRAPRSTSCPAIYIKR